VARADQARPVPGWLDKTAGATSTVAGFIPRGTPLLGRLVAPLGYTQTAVLAAGIAVRQYRRDKAAARHRKRTRLLRAALAGGIHAGGAIGGALAGAVAGAAIGSAILPFGGTVVGGFAGGWFGGSRGERLSARLGDRILNGKQGPAESVQQDH
jgi:hypothetical protein